MHRFPTRSVFPLTNFLWVVPFVSLFALSTTRVFPQEPPPPAAATPDDTARTPAEEAANKLAKAIDAQNQGWLISSRILLEEALVLNPDTPGIKYFRAIQELREGHSRRAAVFARASVQAGQNLAESHTLLGLLAMRDRDFAEAEEQTRSAIKADPGNARGYYNLSEVLRWSGKPQEALTQLEIAAKKEPNDPIIPLKIRLTQIESGQKPTFVRAKDSTGNDKAAWLLTEAALAMEGNNLARAASLLVEARALLPPEFLYPVLAEDHFFQSYSKEPELAAFYDPQPQ